MDKVTEKYTVYIFRSARGCLSYIIASVKGGESLLIDPSVEVGNEYESILSDKKLTLRYIVDTHTHADHISAYSSLEKTGARYCMHERAPSKRVHYRVRDEDTLSVGDVMLRVLHTPGHAADSITLVLPDAVFTADTLLVGGTGRTDLREDSSSAELYESIWQKIIPLGDAVRVYPGHDYQGRVSSTIGDEKATNPRLALSRDEFIRHLDAHHPPKPELLEDAIRLNSE